MLSVGRLKLDGDLEVGFNVYSLEDLSEGTFVDLADDFVVLSYFFWHFSHFSRIIYLNNN